MYACDIHKFPTERHVVITVSEINPERHVVITVSEINPERHVVITVSEINPERHVVITVSEINRLFHYDKSQYQCRHNWKSHWVSDNEKQLPFWNVILAYSKV